MSCASPEAGDWPTPRPAPRDGVPVIYYHGAIGSPLEGSVDLRRMTRELGVRHIAINRPGVGGSDPDPGRTIVGFAADVRELADELELEPRAGSGG